MIGPHQGKELELMLTGEKKLAVFHDSMPDDGASIPEEIIPDKAFAPHVQCNALKRFEKTIINKKNNDAIKFVCFTLPEEEWRAEFFLWLEEQVFSQELDYNISQDEIIGKLLGYSEIDIKDFVERKASFSRHS